MQIYVATSNAGKLRDFAQSAATQKIQAAAEGIQILPLPGLDAMPEPAEDAPDFAGNAALKAVAYSLHAPGLLVLADDSGLEVDALAGQPGVRSARFADDMNFETGSGFGKDDRNNRCLLALLGTSPLKTSPLKTSSPETSPLDARDGPTRRARFTCALALARNGELLHRATGTVEGEILDTPRGTNGFGYDPLFLIPALGKTMAEVNSATRWALSHRGHAFRTLLETLKLADTHSPTPPPSSARFRTT